MMEKDQSVLLLLVVLVAVTLGNQGLPKEDVKAEVANVERAELVDWAPVKDVLEEEEVDFVVMGLPEFADFEELSNMIEPDMDELYEDIEEEDEQENTEIIKDVEPEDQDEEGEKDDADTGLKNKQNSLRKKIWKKKMKQAMKNKRKHQRKHHRRHHRRHNWKEAKHWNQTTLEQKVNYVCKRMNSRPHALFQKRIRRVEERNPGKHPRRSYRLEFLGNMTDCCSLESKVQCFMDLRTERLNHFCDEDMPWAPWKKLQSLKAKKLKQNCCAKEGEIRYQCFHKTWQQWQNVAQELDDGKEADEDIDNTETTVAGPKGVSKTSDRKQWHKNFQRKIYKKMQKKASKKEARKEKKTWKHDCCENGKSVGEKVTAGKWAVCKKSAIKFTKKTKTNKTPACKRIFKKCCLKNAKRSRKEMTTSTEPTLV